jgi:hypothetical protein
VPEVVDAGSWQLGPPLDDLLRVTGVRSGAQSQWLEVDLALSLDLGVVKLSSATVRIAFGAGGIEGLELRGLRAAVDIPGTVRGEGALDVSAGVVHAGIELEVIPLAIGAVADLAIGDQGFVELSVGVRFPAPIPFANSGLGLFGVAGRFVSNGRRALDAGNPDPVERELAWLAKSPPKYQPQHDQYALGLGAVVGTVPDAGFTFHALGMLTVEFPRPAVIFGVISEVLGGTAPVPVERADRPGYGLSIIGLVVVDDTAVTVALRGHYEVPGLLVLDVPVGGWFPYANPTDSWVHVGADGQPGRAGSPVTITLLPDVLDVRVWAFVMVHGNGLSPGLMGKPELEFSGFAIGFGAGWEIDWSAGPIRLEASAMVLAGFGTDPLLLAAGIWVRGSLDLVVISIAARGEITLLTDGERTDLHGEFCGEVDCFFFSIEGCVEINISATLGGPDAPPSPIAGIDLVSRRGSATAKAAGADSGELPRVWPDTIPVIHFAHFVRPDVGGGDFSIQTPMPGPVWSGSRDLKYAYRITAVTLETVGGAAFHPPPGGHFDTAWWWPGVRSTTAPPGLSAAGSETRDLALLTWEPWTGLLPLTEPAGSPADPGGLVGDLCDPVRAADPVCVLGELGRPAGPGAAILAEASEGVPLGRPPTRLLTSQPGDVGWEDVLAATAVGVAVLPGRVTRLHQSFQSATGRDLDSGWRLASFVRDGQPLGALGLAGAYDPAMESVSLVLEVCPVEVGEVRFKPLELPSACAEFAGLDPKSARLATDAGGVLHWSRLAIMSEAGEPPTVVEVGDGIWALEVPREGVRITLPTAADGVTVEQVKPTEFKVIAFDADGNEVAAESSSGETETTVAATGIVGLLVFGDDGAALSRVCAANPLGDGARVLEWIPEGRVRPTPPEVVGTRADGRREVWDSSVKGGRECLEVHYEAPSEGPWARVRIAPAPGCEVTVVSSCGVRWEEALQHRAAERQRNDVLAAIVAHATGPPGTIRAHVLGLEAFPLALAGPPPRPLLPADVELRLSITWEWQSWTRNGGGGSPGPVDEGAWQPGGTDVFRFRTAAAAPPATPPPPVDLISEASFDPRNTARFVTGSQPSGELPHLLDDPIRITFSVDYLPALLAAYGYEARVEVRPTDVAPGSVGPTGHPPDAVDFFELVTWIGDGALLPVERRVIEAAEAEAPCVPATGLGGVAAEVHADLEPDTPYDVLLVAHPTGGGADRVVSRSHFRTSRYRDVDEVLARLGLSLGAPTAVAPADALLETWPSLPAGERAKHDDSELDAALSALGLDPWPLADTPRVTTLWVPPDPPARPGWGLAGVLLEAREPIARRDRIEVSGSAGATALSHLRGTTSGTRVLLAPPGGPVALAPADALRVRLADSLRGRVAEGSALLLGGPRTIRREAS